MNVSRLRARAAASACALAGIAWLSPNASAQTASDRLPDLLPLPATDFSLVPDFQTPGGSTLRFSTTSWNKGVGPLELAAGEVDTGSGKQKVYQRVFLSDGTSFLHYAGTFQYHDEHSHFHFDDFALYTLQPVSASGGSQRTRAPARMRTRSLTIPSGS